MSRTGSNFTTEMIESKIDKGAVQRLSVTTESGGISFLTMADAAEFAKLMSVSEQAVPAHCRNRPGVCLALTIQAIEWRMSPFAVANKSYVVNDRVAYESQLIHAVIEQRAPITCRLRHTFSGTGDSRRCKVWATAKGEEEPLVYESPEFKQIQPKNSPLWKTKPDLQLYYNASRDWARMYFPDVIMGVYSDDEMMDSLPPAPKTTKSLANALASETVVEQLDESVDVTPVAVNSNQQPVAEEQPTKEEPKHLTFDDFTSAYARCTTRDDFSRLLRKIGQYEMTNDQTIEMDLLLSQKIDSLPATDDGFKLK